MLSTRRKPRKRGNSAPQDEAVWAKTVSHAFSCLLHAQVDERGLGKYFAGSLLRPLFGAPLVDGIPADARFGKVAKLLGQREAGGRGAN